MQPDEQIGLDQAVPWAVNCEHDGAEMRPVER